MYNKRGIIEGVFEYSFCDDESETVPGIIPVCVILITSCRKQLNTLLRMMMGGC